jgi:hypothetical protein
VVKVVLDFPEAMLSDKQPKRVELRRRFGEYGKDATQLP